MILAQTRYKTHDGELLAIVEAFKTWHHYLKGCKHEVLVLTNHNNLRSFMDTKSLSSRQVRWVQELSWYHFQIDYHQNKANGTADAHFCFLQRSHNKEEKLWAKNTQVFHRLQTSLTNASLSGLSLNSAIDLSPLHRVYICGTHVLPQLRQFWGKFRMKLADKNPYKACTGCMRLRLSELQESDPKGSELKSKDELSDSWEDTDGVLYHQGLPFIPEVIWTKLISQHHNDLLVEHFGINKTKDLIGKKYYWPSLQNDIEAYIKGCDVRLGSKAVRQKPYSNLQSLLVPTYRWKDLSIDFVTRLPISTNWKGDSYDSILIVVDRLTKIVHYELVKITINAPGLEEVIINVVIQHYGLPDSIISDHGAIFTSKFWSSLCYFLGIKRRLSTAFHPQTDRPTEQQNSTIEAYLWAFVNIKQNDWARLLPMAKFAYNNVKNVSTGFSPFKLNCSYHLRILYEEEVDSRFKSKLADELSAELGELMIVCQ